MLSYFLILLTSVEGFKCGVDNFSVPVEPIPIPQGRNNQTRALYDRTAEFAPIRVLIYDAGISVLE